MADSIGYVGEIVSMIEQKLDLKTVAQLLRNQCRSSFRSRTMSVLQLTAFFAVGLLAAAPASAVLKSCPGAVLDLEWFQKNAETFVLWKHIAKTMVKQSEEFEQLVASADFKAEVEATRKSLTPKVPWFSYYIKSVVKLLSNV